MGKGCVACGCLEYKVLLDLDCGGFDNSPLYEIVIVFQQKVNTLWR